MPEAAGGESADNTPDSSLGLKLFQRGQRRLSFTTAGERLFGTSDMAFAQLADSIEALAGCGKSRPKVAQC